MKGRLLIREFLRSCWFQYCIAEPLPFRQLLGDCYCLVHSNTHLPSLLKWFQVRGYRFRLWTPCHLQHTSPIGYDHRYFWGSSCLLCYSRRLPLLYGRSDYPMDRLYCIWIHMFHQPLACEVIHFYLRRVRPQLPNQQPKELRLWLPVGRNNHRRFECINDLLTTINSNLTFEIMFSCVCLYWHSNCSSRSLFGCF